MSIFRVKQAMTATLVMLVSCLASLAVVLGLGAFVLGAGLAVAAFCGAPFPYWGSFLLVLGGFVSITVGNYVFDAREDMSRALWRWVIG